MELFSSVQSTTRLFATQMKLEIALEQGHGHRAIGILDSISQARSVANLKPEDLEPHEIHALHAFSVGKYRDAIVYAEQWLNLSQAHGDRIGQVQALSLLGVAHAARGKLNKSVALTQLETALDIARQEGTTAVRLRALVRGVAAALLLDAPQHCELWLIEGKTTAQNIEAERWKLCFREIFNFTAQLSTLRERVTAWLKLQSSELGFARDLYLIENSIGFFPLNWHSAMGAGLALWPEHAVVFFPKCHLVANRRILQRKSEIHIQYLDPHSPIGIVAFAFMSKQIGTGLSLKEIHKLISSAPFRRERHEGHIRTIVTRTRHLFEALDIGLRWHRGSEQFERIGKAVREIHLGEKSPVKRGRPSSRNQRTSEIFEFIHENGFVSTTDLTTRFQITRQGLHPIISILVEDGMIQRVKKGKKSGVASNSASCGGQGTSNSTQ